jgi:hypothetical protein
VATFEGGKVAKQMTGEMRERQARVFAEGCKSASGSAQTQMDCILASFRAAA